jgi:hypothetical protein
VQNRRGFFKSIAGLFAVAVVAPATLLYKELPAYLPDTGPALGSYGALQAQRDMQRLTNYIHSSIVESLRLAPGPTLLPVAPEGRVSPAFPYQLAVDFDIKPEDIARLDDEMLHERYVKPITSMFVSEINMKQAYQFSELPLPHGVDAACRATGDGISIRGLRAFDFGGPTHDPGWVHRFDILFAGSV